jgi:hypothetical protein
MKPKTIMPISIINFIRDTISRYIARDREWPVQRANH